MKDLVIRKAQPPVSTFIQVERALKQRLSDIEKIVDPVERLLAYKEVHDAMGDLYDSDKLEEILRQGRSSMMPMFGFTAVGGIATAVGLTVATGGLAAVPLLTLSLLGALGSIDI